MIGVRGTVCAGVLVATTLAAPPGEPGSGVYAANCANSQERFTVDISSRGTATVGYKGETYADQLTSYSFFGKATPGDFHIAVLFDRKRTPLPPFEDSRSWIEIWQGEAAFYAVPNGDNGKRLNFCAQLPVTVTPGTDFDCNKASRQVEKLICADKVLARRDWALAAIYRKALGRIAGDDAQVKALKAEQRGWIKGRNDCWKARDMRGCVLADYGDRHATLLARFGLIEAGPTEVWTCDGTSRPLYVTPFMTEPPTINLVRGDEMTTAIQRRAASGSRYEAPFGISFWIKGTEATLAWPQGSKSNCRYAMPSSGK